MSVFGDGTAKQDLFDKVEEFRFDHDDISTAKLIELLGELIAYYAKYELE